MSTDLNVCRGCGRRDGAHAVTCIAVAVVQAPPIVTAYDRDQQALRDRVAALESRVDGNTGATVMLIESQRDRLTATMRCIEQVERDLVLLHNALVARGPCNQLRIEQLEQEVARLKAWSRPPAEMCISCGTGFTTPRHAASHRCTP